MKENRVIKKILYYVDVRCAAPVCVSNGEEELTDQDVLKDYAGKPFIAGTSLAGAMRNYLGWERDEDCLFGFSREEKDGGKAGRGSVACQGGRMSSVFISDIIFRGNVVTTVRDGVGLNERKVTITKAKYDLEVVDTDTVGRFIIEAVIRGGKPEEEARVTGQIAEALAGLNRREIRLGAKKSRGFGEIEISAIRKKEYSRENIREYKDAYVETEYMKLADCKESILEAAGKRAQYVRIRVPLKLEGGISIRRYSAKKGEPDYTHLTSGGKPGNANIPGNPVIPGTSSMGAVRHRVKEILCQLEVPKSEQLLNAIFGYVDKEKKKAHKSGVIMGECIIKDAKPLTMVRNAVSRFESAAKAGALYKEKAYFGGTTELELYVQKGIRVPDEECTGYITGDITDMAIGILLVALKDMQNGYLPIGGQTAIGRGILKADGDITIDGSSEDVGQYLLNCMRIKEVLA